MRSQEKDLLMDVILYTITGVFLRLLVYIHEWQWKEIEEMGEHECLWNE